MKFSFPYPRRVDPTKDPANSIIEDSVYVLLLGDQIVGIIIALGVLVAQYLVLATFGFSEWGQEGSSSGEQGDSLPVRIRVLGVVLVLLHLGSELLKGLQLVSIGIPWQQKHHHLQAILPGAAVLSVTCITLGVAINYIVKISDNVVALVQDVFILLFVLEMDEKCFDIVRYYDPIWTRALLDSISRRCEGVDDGELCDAGDEDAAIDNNKTPPTQTA